MQDQDSSPRKGFGSWLHEGEPMELSTRRSGGAQAGEANAALSQAPPLPSLEPWRSSLDSHHVLLPRLPAQASSSLHPLCQLGNWFLCHFYARGLRICSRRQSLTKKRPDVSPSALLSLHIQERPHLSQEQPHCRVYRITAGLQAWEFKHPLMGQRQVWSHLLN